MITCSCDTSAAEAGLDALDAVVLEATRPAAQAGAEVFYREVLTRVPVMAVAKQDKRGKVHQPGALKAAIYQAFSADQSQALESGYGKAEYHVSWNARKAPHGHLVEYGHVQRFAVARAPDGQWYTTKKPITPRHVAARPFVRPAFDAAQGKALGAVDDEFRRRVQPALGQGA